MSTALATQPRSEPAQAFTVEHFRSWSSKLVCDNDKHFDLEPFQEAWLKDVFAGFPICWLIVPEGNGKTTFISALMLYAIRHREGVLVPVAASAADQATRIYEQAEGFVWRSPLMDFRCLEGFKRIRCDLMHSRIQIFPGDDRTGDGIIPGSFAALDELHRHRSLALYETWKGKLNKRAAQLLVISTAGEVGSEFEHERERLRQQATHVERDGAFVRAETRFEGRPIAVVHEYAVPEGGDVNDLALVKQANPYSGWTDESLAEKRVAVGNDQHWARFTCNLATRQASAAISEIEWENARSTDEIPELEPVWVGLDLGWKVDPTAIVPLWVRAREYRLFGKPMILVPPRNQTNIDPRLIEDALRNIAARNPIEVVVMDMTNGNQLATWIESELGAKVVDRDQHLPAQVLDYARFTEGLRERWIKHPGDLTFTRHVLNALARVLPGGEIVFARPKDSRSTSKAVQEQREIDALVAAAMVHTAATDRFSQPTSSWAAI